MPALQPALSSLLRQHAPCCNSATGAPLAVSRLAAVSQQIAGDAQLLRLQRTAVNCRLISLSRAHCHTLQLRKVAWQ